MRLAFCLGLCDESASVVTGMLAPPVPDVQGADAATIVRIPQGAFGWVPRSNDNPRLARQYTGPDGSVLVVAGTPITLGQQVGPLLHEASQLGPDAVSELARRLDGVFALLYWHPDFRSFLVCTDGFGFFPMFWCRNGPLVLGATSQAAIAKSGRISVSLNPGSWGAMFRYGATLGDATLGAEIERVPRASCIRWDAGGQQLKIDSNSWRPEPNESLNLNNFDTTAVIDLLQQEVRAYQQWYPDAPLTLSGGGDSRFILAVVAGNACKHSITVNHADEMFDLDGRIAVKLGKMFLGRADAIKPPRDYYSSVEYFDFMQLHELAAPSAELFIATLYGAFRQAGYPAMWSAFMPGYHLFPGGAENGEVLSAYLDQVLQPVQRRIVQEPVSLFAQGNEMLASFEEMLRLEKLRFPDTQDSVDAFALLHRARNRVSAIPFRALGALSESLTPGISRAIVAHSLALPRRWRSNHELWRLLFERHFPKYLRFPVISRGQVKITRDTSQAWKLACKLASTYRDSIPHRIVMKLTRSSAGYFRPSQLVDRMISEIDPGHPDLNADAVRKLQLDGPGDRRDWPRQYTRQLLFHWKVWRDLMEGRAAEARARLFEGGTRIVNAE